MSLADIIDFFDRQRGGTYVTDAFARDIARSLREVEDELIRRRQQLAALRAVEVQTRAVR